MQALEYICNLEYEEHKHSQKMYFKEFDSEGILVI